MADRPAKNAKRDDWIAYAVALEVELGKARSSGSGDGDSELVRQLRRRVHQLTGGRTE